MAKERMAKTLREIAELDPSKHLPNTTETGWVFSILKKHVLVGQPIAHAHPSMV